MKLTENLKQRIRNLNALMDDCDNNDCINEIIPTFFTLNTNANDWSKNQIARLRKEVRKLEE